MNNNEDFPPNSDRDSGSPTPSPAPRGSAPPSSMSPPPPSTAVNHTSSEPPSSRRRLNRDSRDTIPSPPQSTGPRDGPSPAPSNSSLHLAAAGGLSGLRGPGSLRGGYHSTVPNNNHHLTSTSSSPGPHHQRLLQPSEHHLPPLQPNHIVVNSHEVKSEGEDVEELLLKWDDHHRSFFELAEELCHNEQFIDVTLSCGEHNFPAHKLVLSVCSPYFRHLFLRNPCKHPIVVLKDVSSKYMKLLLMYMYRGEVSCPQEDLAGLLKTARSLQIRGLVELERKREAEGLTNSVTGSPIKRALSDVHDGASTTSCDMDSREGHNGDFNIDDVRSRLNGQLEIQPISQPSSSSPYPPPQQQPGGNGVNGHPPPSWLDEVRHPGNLTSKIAAAATSSSTDLPPDRSHSIAAPSDLRVKDMDRLYSNNSPGNGGTDLTTHHRRSPLNAPARPRSRTRPGSSTNTMTAATAASNAALMAAAQAAGMPASALDPSDPMSSMNALLAAAQAHGNSPLPSSTLASLLPSSSSTSSSPSSTAAASSTPPVSSAVSSAAAVAAAAAGPPPGAPPGSNGQPTPPGAPNGPNGANGNVDLSQAAAVANLQLYYYMQKVASAGMGNPKERKECPICGKTLYDRSTWNRHMRIHTGEKPYPCRFCGRRFRTNYNKIGHEKKCPDRHARALLNQQNSNTSSPATNGPTSENVVYR